jgi:hypothetical protein
MKLVSVFALVVASLAVGCAAEAGDPGADVEDIQAGRIQPGTFKLYDEPFHTVSPGCDLHTSLELKQTSRGPVAILEERVGGMCAVVSIPNHREYKLKKVASACRKVYEGETIVKNGVGLEPNGVSKIRITDNRGVTCMDAPFQGEIVVSETLARIGGPDTTELFSAPVPVEEERLGGNWGADQAILSFRSGVGRIEFGCALATFENVTFTSDKAFTATGSHLAGSGIPFPPGHEPQPQAATFTGEVRGGDLKLDMTVDGQTTRLSFKKDREINLIRCL